MSTGSENTTSIWREPLARALTSVGGVLSAETPITCVSVKPANRAVIVAVPLLLVAVRRPVELTLTTFVLLDWKITHAVLATSWVPAAEKFTNTAACRVVFVDIWFVL